jgi:addiction module HigA family antidote
MARSAIHPGEHLAEAIGAMGITAAQLARDIKVPANRVPLLPRKIAILHFTRAITADTALRLGRYFGTSPEFWMNLQQIYELRRAEQELGDGIKAIPRRKAKAARGPRGGSAGFVLFPSPPRKRGSRETARPTPGFPLTRE